jgi:hypothetical protein
MNTTELLKKHEWAQCRECGGKGTVENGVYRSDNATVIDNIYCPTCSGSGIQPEILRMVEAISESIEIQDNTHDPCTAWLKQILSDLEKW